ncbi:MULTISPECIES: GNAT family N-acetyltransferase [unclassified Peribacillus]|uniref:GNAT family N-acetyltransferase n=1 Tax=unclassified Peribacillus TaxID=2675266 RepID=UPI0038222257
MVIREIRVDDAGDFINLVKDVEHTSEFMLMEPGERKATPEKQRKQLEAIEKQQNSTIFVAEDEGKLVGYLMAIGGSVKRTNHSAYLVIGILEECRGKGIGTSLFQNVIKWASHHDISRLELTTVTQNEAGVALYKKFGFEIEGTKRNSLVIQGKSYNEYYMSKLL